MKPITTTLFASAALLMSGWAAYAEPSHHTTMNHTQAASSSESAKAFEHANMMMHKNMQQTMTGDADIDFVRGMIAHHQGAIDMSEVELKYGKDPDVRKLANEIMAAQKKEIEWMQDWVAKHPVK